MWIWNELSGLASPEPEERSGIRWRELSPQTSLYDLFGLPADATEQQITKRYRELARRYHPDLRPEAANVTMTELNVAFEVLRDPARRAAYDREHGFLS